MILFTDLKTTVVIIFTITACGGAIEEDGAAVGGAGTVGGGSSGTQPGTRGGFGPTSGSTTPICFGVADTTPSDFCVGTTLNLKPMGKDAKACIYNVPIASGLRLNPDLLKLYFAIDTKGRLEVPYVGTVGSCPQTGTAGGWYASNVAGGSSQIGLCGCSCEAAKEHALKLVIECSGIR
jgi:hypothetical protein